MNILDKIFIYYKKTSVLKSTSILLFTIFTIIAILSFMNLFFHYQTAYLTTSPDLEDAYATVLGEDITITFFSNKTIYHPGEELEFYIDVTNRGEEFIPVIDFTLNAKYYSLFNIDVFTKTHYSDRGFEGNKPERIRVGERVDVGQRLPGIIPSGIYALELVATPENKDPTSPAKVKIYIVQDQIIFLLFTFIFSVVPLAVFLILGIIYIISPPTASYIVRSFIVPVLKRVPRVPSVKVNLSKVDASELKYAENVKILSIGETFVFIGICFLFFMAITLTTGLTHIAEKFAILLYYSLVIGVINSLWEHVSESKEENTPNRTPLRMSVSLLFFSSLVYFSKTALGDLLAQTTIGFLLIISLFILLHNTKDWDTKRLEVEKYFFLSGLLVPIFWISLIFLKINSFYPLGIAIGCLHVPKTSFSLSLNKKQ